MDYKKLLASLLLCYSVSFLGSIISAPAISTWYPTLSKPFLNPPNWVFAPVWITLYTLMGISLSLVWDKGIRHHKVKDAVVVFLSQLGANLLWSIVFFGFHSLNFAFLVIVLLWALILYTMKLFHHISLPAFYLLIPYIIWVSFALVLNLFILVLNR